MPAIFILDLATDTPARRATLRLQDEDARHLAAHQVALDDHAPSLWSGLFDTRRHVDRMKGVEAPASQLATLGRFLGEHVLGSGIAAALAEGVDQRTLLVRLPDPTANNLAAAFARVPWEIARVGRAIGIGDHDVARTRFNRYGPLMRLGKLAEAKSVLEDCLDVFHRVEDVMNEGRALSALGQVWYVLGDRVQTIALERRALALRDRLPDPGDRTISHNNLSNSLLATGASEEARAHQLAALVYCLATGIDPRSSLNNLALRIRQSAARGETFTFPPLAALLATAAFAPLRTFLADNAIPTDQHAFMAASKPTELAIDELTRQTSLELVNDRDPGANGAEWFSELKTLAAGDRAHRVRIYLWDDAHYETIMRPWAGFSTKEYFEARQGGYGALLGHVAQRLNYEVRHAFARSVLIMLSNDREWVDTLKENLDKWYEDLASVLQLPVPAPEALERIVRVNTNRATPSS